MREVDKSTPRAICGAKTRSGGQCQSPPMAGQKRCRMHGGATPIALEKAKARLAEAAALAEVEAFGGRRDVTPAEALLELVQSKAAEVAYWQRLVRELMDSERAGMLATKTEDAPLGMTETKQAAAHIYLTLLHKAQDQLAAYSAAAIRAGATQAMIEAVMMQAAWLLPVLYAVIEQARTTQAAADVIVRGVIEQGAN